MFHTVLAAARLLLAVPDTVAAAWRLAVLLCRWDKYHQLPINRRMLKTLTLDECQKTCSGNDFDCTFVVFQRTTGNCWPKYSW